MNIVITGASRGIGNAIAGIYASEGHTVFSMSRKVPGHDTSGNGIRHFQGDVSREEDVAGFAEFCRTEPGVIDVLINNAAVHLEQDQPDILDLDFSVYGPSFLINSIGPLMMAKHFLPLMRHSEKKLIVSISSEAGSISDSRRQREFSYCMSKAALNMGMKILQNRVKSEGMRVLIIHPGWVRTDMGGDAANLGAEESASAMYRNLLDADLTELRGMYYDWQGREMRW